MLTVETLDTSPCLRWKQTKMDSVSNKKSDLFNELVDQLNRLKPGAHLSLALRKELEKFPLEARKEIVNRVREDCSPLFIACKKGHQRVAKYLIQTCGADIEQEGTHLATPLWCAAVAGKSYIVRLLFQSRADSRADINSVSATGSTPIMSSCIETLFQVVRNLVHYGADFDYEGTCLISSVHCAKLCRFLLKNGANVNAKDIHNKTALHYAIEQGQLEIVKLLLEYGADCTAKSRYGYDALQMACFEGATEIFEYLTLKVSYSPETIANALELLGTTFVDKRHDVTGSLRLWKQALKIRNENGLLPKQPVMPLQEEYRNQREFETLDELMAMSGDLDKIGIQSLLIVERILGTHHEHTILRLKRRGNFYAKTLRYQRCIELWRRALKIRTKNDPIFHEDIYFIAEELVKMMLHFNIKSVQNSFDNTEQRFHDIMKTFELLSKHIVNMKSGFLIRPQYEMQLGVFGKIIRYITHLIYLSIDTAKTKSNKKLVTDLLKRVIDSNVKCYWTGDSILHMCVSRLTTLTPYYYLLDKQMIEIFPDVNVLKQLLECGANIHVKNESGRTPLHIATMPDNYSPQLVKLLLDFGAHLDVPDAHGHTSLDAIRRNHAIGDISFINYTTLQCLCATQIVKKKISYVGQLPNILENFVRLHDPYRSFRT